MNTPDTIPDRADLMLLIEEYAEARHKHGAPEYNFTSSAARDKVIEALAARSLAGTPQAEPLKAAPDAVSERLHEFRVRLSEYGVAMYHEQSQKAKVLADVLSSMLEAAISTTQQAAKSAEASDDEQREEIEAVIACLGDDAASLREDNSEDERAANMERAAELLESLSVPMPAGAAVGEWQPIETAPKDGTLLVLGARNGVWLGKYLPVYTSGYRPENPWSSMLLNHDHMAERFTRPTHWQPLPVPPTTGGASTPTGGAKP